MKIYNYIATIFLILFSSNCLIAGTYSGGAGTLGNPYQIATTADLMELSKTSADWVSGKYFIQTGYISFNANEQLVDWDGDGNANWDPFDQLGFLPIGNNSTNFQGSYDGQNYTISYIYINRASSDDIGLFGTTNGATIANVGLIDCFVLGQSNVGGLVGNNNSSSISNCFSTGTVGGALGVGVLVGANTTSQISNCYSTGTSNGIGWIGGLVGANLTNSFITYSYSTGNGSGAYAVGGLVGNNTSSSVSNSYSTGTVTRTSGSHTGFGGFCGYNGGTIDKCYSTGKVYESVGTIWDELPNGKDRGFVGSHAGTSTNNFFDATTSEQTSSSDGATATTTANMKIEGTFTNWDFSGDAETDWVLSSVITFSGYPTLRWTGAYSVAPTGSPKEIATLPNLVWIAENNSSWADSYIQTANIVTWTTPSWDGNQGWTSIGINGIAFSGVFNGQNFTVSNLYINRNSSDNIGLFGFTASATFSNISVVGSNITGSSKVGGLVGYVHSSSSISNCYATGSVSGSSSVGGLVGSYHTNGSISNCYSTGSVSGSSYIGGLVGLISSICSISNCYSTGSVSGSSNVGGLVGYNSSSSSISNSYSIGSVSGSSNVGGLVGYNYTSSSILNSYSTGSVSGSSYVGGLVGYNNSSSSISNSYSTGSVSGTDEIGGLAGRNTSTSSISNSYSIGSVSGSSYVGGLVGRNMISSTISNSYSTGSVSGSTNVGGFIGFYGIGTLTSNYWKTDGVGGLEDTGNGGDIAEITETSDANMKIQGTFSGWDFTPTPHDWNIKTGSYISYPYIQGITYDTPGVSPEVNPIPGLEVVCQATVNVDASYNSGTTGWGISHFADLSLALAGVCAGGTVNLSNSSALLFEGDVVFDGLTVIIGDHDFELKGDITSGFVQATNAGKLKMIDLAANTTKTFPITDGTYKYTMTITTADVNNPDISVRIKNNNEPGSINSDFWDIDGPTNLNATITLRVDKAAIAPKTLGSSTQLRYRNSGDTRYVPVNGNNFSIEEFDTYYIITLTGVNEF